MGFTGFFQTPEVELGDPTYNWRRGPLRRSFKLSEKRRKTKLQKQGPSGGSILSEPVSGCVSFWAQKGLNISISGELWSFMEGWYDLPPLAGSVENDPRNRRSSCLEMDMFYETGLIVGRVWLQCMDR